jgi:hypothetical protein
LSERRAGELVAAFEHEARGKKQAS